jgi:hypothetical protein
MHETMNINFIRHTLLFQLHYKCCSLLQSLLQNSGAQRKLLWISYCVIPQPTHCSSDKTRLWIIKTKQKEKENTFLLCKAAYKKWNLKHTPPHMHSAGKHNRQNHDNPAHRPCNYTWYDIPPIRLVFQVTQKDLWSSLMMADYCQNM